MNNLIKQDRDRLRLFKKYGYDIPEARDFIINKVRLTKGSLLEIGTGRGHMAAALAKKGLKLVSIDLDRKAQRVAKAKLKAMKVNKLVTFKIMNAEKLRYKDNSFDYVISVNFIHHAKNPVKCLKEMVRVAKKKLVIADLNKRGERIMKKVHGLDGHKHPPSRMSLSFAKVLLRKLGMIVKTYHDSCQIVLIAKKGVAK
jgi:ubiquinone/menaquinone biosynthesis C-methylase UbiE